MSVFSNLLTITFHLNRICSHHMQMSGDKLWIWSILSFL